MKPVKVQTDVIIYPKNIYHPNEQNKCFGVLKKKPETVISHTQKNFN